MPKWDEPATMNDPDSPSIYWEPSVATTPRGPRVDEITAESIVLKRMFATAGEWMAAKNRRNYLRHQAQRQEYQRTYDRANRDVNRKRTREWVAADPARKRKSDRASHVKHRTKRVTAMRDRKANDPAFDLIGRSRSRLHQALHKTSNAKMHHTIDILGCTGAVLHKHIKKQMDNGLTLKDVEVDHIFPCDAYDFNDPESQFTCFNYKNLQPLLPKENRTKNTMMPTKAMAAKVPSELWPPGITEDMLPDKYDGWETPLRM